MSQPKGSFPIAKEGLPFISGFLLAGGLLSLIPVPFTRLLGLLLFVLSVFSCFFFRDPERTAPLDPAVVLAPGDGVVLEVSEEESPYWSGKAQVVKIFLSIFNVHVQRSPIAGKVVQVDYRKGKFLDARDPRAAFENEQNAILIEGSLHKIAVKQIAGLIARRIVCWARPGQNLAAGQRLGLIRFGSQVDLVLPADLEVCVRKGEKMTGGVSVVAVHKKIAQPRQPA